MASVSTSRVPRPIVTWLRAPLATGFLSLGVRPEWVDADGSAAGWAVGPSPRGAATAAGRRRAQGELPFPAGARLTVPITTAAISARQATVQAMAKRDR